MIAAPATFHHCISRKQFEQWPYQSKALSVHVEGYDRDLAGEGKPQSSAVLSQHLELSIVTPLRARLSHEEPEAGNLHVRARKQRERVLFCGTSPILAI